MRFARGQSNHSLFIRFCIAIALLTTPIAKAEPSTLQLSVTYPTNGAIFPIDFSPPTFRWKDTSNQQGWIVTLTFTDGGMPLKFECPESQWRPDKNLWEKIKQRSLNGEATFSVEAAVESSRLPGTPLAQITFETSTDPVGAPIFYRDVPLPFMDAVKASHTISWKLGWASDQNPPQTVLTNLPMCGNCHSFSADGRTLAMDVDYGNDKGSYVISEIDREVNLNRKDIITWSDYRRNDGDRTYGLLSQISPDGRFVISTVKDKSVQLPAQGIAYSQLFFPIRGVLVVYDRGTGRFTSLPGADDPDFVQSNPGWSPDGKWVVFTRARADTYENIKEKYVLGGKKFRYDLYRVPFNGGRGGKAVPVLGASDNGKSNYFPKYSPDGKWIVFCSADSYMLLQSDSILYIIPAEGGIPRRMRCNVAGQMNSWHSWSPNGRWIVFASKAQGPYTQLWLSHIDRNGTDAPPVLLENFMTKDRAANIPEFVNISEGKLSAINPNFLKNN